MDATLKQPTPAKGAPKATGNKDEKAILARVQGYLAECKPQDARFRKRAIESLKFYFGEQWEASIKRDVEDREQSALVINEVRSAIRTVLGLMLGQPFDWLAKPVGLADDELADIATQALKYVAGRNLSTDTYKRVYFWALAYGVGWTYAGPYVRVKDRRREVVQFRWVDSREVRLDPLSREPDLADARFLDWARRMPIEVAKKKWPKADLEAQEGGRDANLDDSSKPEGKNEGLTTLTPPQSMWDRLDDWNYVDRDTRDGIESKSVIVHDTWEVITETAWLYETLDGNPVEFPGPSDPKGAATLAQLHAAGKLKAYYEDEVPHVYVRTWCGPLLLATKREKIDRIPWSACFYERDQFGDPVSAIESMKDLQRDLNYRSSKAQYEMSAKPMRVAPEVLARMGLTNEAAATLAADPGAFWVANAGEVDFLNRPDMSSQQLEVATTREQQIKATSGANNDLQGAPSQSLSGVSKQITMQQGTTMQRDSEANLRLYHQLLGELVMWYIQDEHTEQWTFRVADELGRDRMITANQQQQDPLTGQMQTIRNLNSAPFEICIDEMPWTPTLRERNAQIYADMAANEPDPNIRAALRKIQVTVADIPQKGKILEILDGAEQARQQTPPPPPPRKDLRDNLNIKFELLAPEVQSAILQNEWGISVPNPSQPPQPAPGASPIGDNGPPALDPGKLLAEANKAQMHKAGLDHQKAQAEADRAHQMGMAAMQHAHTQAQNQGQLSGQAGMALLQHGLTPPPAPTQGGSQ